MKDPKIERIKEICDFYEESLKSYRNVDMELDSSTREHINLLRRESLNEICELIREL